MRELIRERQTATLLRRKGLSYNEILKLLDVSRSTLSLWLREVPLTVAQRVRLEVKRSKAALIGAAARRAQTDDQIQSITERASREVGRLSKRELWLIGTSLYWGEGRKEKTYRRGDRVALANSDPRIIRLFTRWLQFACRVPSDQIIYELYVHRSVPIAGIREYWERQIGIPKDRLRLYYKHHRLRKYRNDVHRDYRGLVRVVVRKSVHLNRRIAGWIEGIAKYSGVV